MPAEMHVTGFRHTMRALRKMGPEVQRGVQREMRDVVGPTVADARARFGRLSRRPGRRTGQTVRGAFTQNAVDLRLGGRHGFELGVEFGAKSRPRTSTFMQRRASGPVKVTRTMDYSKVFGPWTGNQWTAVGRPPGNAFYPAVRDHYDELMTELVGVVDRAFDDVVSAS